MGKHMVMQAQLDALTANIEQLCQKSGVPVKTAAEFIQAPNVVAAHDDKDFFDAKGNRLTETRDEDGQLVEKVRSWVYTKEDAETQAKEEGVPLGGGATIAPADDIKVIEMES